MGFPDWVLDGVPDGVPDEVPDEVPADIPDGVPDDFPDYCPCPIHYCPCSTARDRGCRVYGLVLSFLRHFLLSFLFFSPSLYPLHFTFAFSFTVCTFDST